MKRLSAALILGFLSLSFCFSQIQTGNASYNASKQGLTISHSSLSFNTRVRVTNLRNNRSVEAAVDGRIPIESGRIADISRDAGEALGMDKTGMTLVELAVLPLHPGASQSASGQTAPPGSPQGAGTAQGGGTAQGAGTPGAGTAQGGGASQGTGTAQQQTASSSAAPQILPVQTVTDIQYVPVAAQPCCSGPLLLAILLLLILAIAILVLILVLVLRRFPLWPCYYPLWLRRRRRRRAKKLRRRR